MDLTPEEELHQKVLADNLALNLVPGAAPAIHQQRINSSTLSETSESGKVLNLLILQIKQVASLNEEQWKQVGVVLQEMQDTLRLQQIMIGNQDESVQTISQTSERLSLIAASLVKATAELSDSILYIQERSGEVDSNQQTQTQKA